MNPNSYFLKTAYFLFAIFMGVFLFFQDPFLPNFFIKGSEDWYVNFSVMIFHPNEAYWNESILLPLIGKLLGASKSFEGYKVLCAVISISILPVLAILILAYFKNIALALICLITFSISFRYLWNYDLGHPDPLTILLLSSIPFLKDKKSIFIFAFLASLSHFSMALVAIIELSILSYAFAKINREDRWHWPIALLCGCIAGRLFLAIWYLIFHYTSPLGRMEFILNSGFLFFYNRYIENIMSFWLTPGISFLLINLMIIFLYLFRKNFWLTLSIALTLAMSYGALFITVDGLRVFSVICCGPYLFLLSRSLNSLKFKAFGVSKNTT
jgi:hypothetical protein